MEEHGWNEVKAQSCEEGKEGWGNQIKKTKGEGRTYKKTAEIAGEWRRIRRKTQQVSNSARGRYFRGCNLSNIKARRRWTQKQINQERSPEETRRRWWWFYVIVLKCVYHNYVLQWKKMIIHYKETIFYFIPTILDELLIFPMDLLLAGSQSYLCIALIYSHGYIQKNPSLFSQIVKFNFLLEMGSFLVKLHKKVFQGTTYQCR